MEIVSLSKKSWLDHLAISMAVICAIHCLVTPVLLVALPIISATFWVDENFHLWMILLVIPTTTLAIWMGCRRHQDKWVLAAAALGLGILVSALLIERLGHAPRHVHAVEASIEVSSVSNTGKEPTTHAAGGGCCSLHPIPPDSMQKTEAGILSAASVPWHALLNTLGGLFLVLGHTRNFLLCRKDHCSHVGG